MADESKLVLPLRTTPLNSTPQSNPSHSVSSPQSPSGTSNALGRHPPRKAIALYDYQPNNDSSKLPFSHGTWLMVTKQDGSGWSRGYVLEVDKSSSLPLNAAAAAGISHSALRHVLGEEVGHVKKGWFPTSYVRIVEEKGETVPRQFPYNTQQQQHQSQVSSNTTSVSDKQQHQQQQQINQPVSAGQQQQKVVPQTKFDGFRRGTETIPKPPSFRNLQDGAITGQHQLDVKKLDPAMGMNEDQEDEAILSMLKQTLARFKAEALAGTTPSVPVAVRNYNQLERQQSASGDLPQHWGKKVLPDGKVYYFNKVNNMTVWNKEDISKAESGKLKQEEDVDSPKPNASQLPRSKTEDGLPISVMSWEDLLKPIVKSVTSLNNAAKANEKWRFLAQTRQVVQRIKHLLQCVDCVDTATSRPLQQYPTLAASNRELMAALSQMVLKAKDASCIWPPPDSRSQLRFQAGQVLLAIRHFVTLARQLNISLLVSTYSAESGVPSASRSNTAATLGDVDAISKLDEFLVGIPAIIEKALESLNANGSYITVSDKAVNYSRELMRQVGNLVTFLDEIHMEGVYSDLELNPDATAGMNIDIPKLIAEHRLCRVSLHNNITGLLTAISVATGAFAPPDAVQQIVINLNLIMKTMKDVGVSTKTLIECKEQLERDGMELELTETFSTTLTPMDTLETLTRPKLKSSGYDLNKTDTAAAKRASMALTAAIASKAVSHVDTFESPENTIEFKHIKTTKKLAQFFGDAPTESTSTASKKITQFFGQKPEVPDPVVATLPRKKEGILEDEEYDPEDVMFSMDGNQKLKAGTVKILVEFLTSHNWFDPQYTTAFLATFHLFTTPQAFIDELTARFRIAPPKQITAAELKEWKEKKRRPIQLRVFKVTKKWVEEFWYESDDGPAIGTIKSFVRDVIAIGLPKEAERILELLTKREAIKSADETMGNINIKLSPGFVSTPTGLTTPSKTFNKQQFLRVYDLSPEDLASQLTVMEFALFNSIHQMEFLVYKPDDRSKPSVSRQGAQDRSPNLRNLIAQSNAITSWVAETILVEPDLKLRAGLIRHFVRIAEKCHTLANYSSREAILAALNSTPVFRLKRTWEGVPQKIRSAFETLSKFMDRENNFMTYRQTLKTASPPCIPFMGLYLTDITFINQGNPDRLGDGRMVNFVKYNRLAGILEEIERLRREPFRIPVNQDIVDFLNSQLRTSRTIQELHELSMTIEPRIRNQTE